MLSQNIYLVFTWCNQYRINVFYGLRNGKFLRTQFSRNSLFFLLSRNEKSIAWLLNFYYVFLTSRQPKTRLRSLLIWSWIPSLCKCSEFTTLFPERVSQGSAHHLIKASQAWKTLYYTTVSVTNTAEMHSVWPLVSVPLAFHLFTFWKTWSTLLVNKAVS